MTKVSADGSHRRQTVSWTGHRRQKRRPFLLPIWEAHKVCVGPLRALE